jgi:hypothetical protein
VTDTVSIEPSVLSNDAVETSERIFAALELTNVDGLTAAPPLDGRTSPLCVAKRSWYSTRTEAALIPTMVTSTIPGSSPSASVMAPIVVSRSAWPSVVPGSKSLSSTSETTAIVTETAASGGGGLGGGNGG